MLAISSDSGRRMIGPLRSPEPKLPRFIRHTACAGFAAAARQIASKLRSYAFGRSGIAAALNPTSSVHQTHRVRRFCCPARQIASELRSYACGRSGSAARINVVGARLAREADFTVSLTHRMLSFAGKPRCNRSRLIRQIAASARRAWKSGRAAFRLPTICRGRVRPRSASNTRARLKDESLLSHPRPAQRRLQLDAGGQLRGDQAEQGLALVQAGGLGGGDVQVIDDPGFVLITADRR